MVDIAVLGLVHHDLCFGCGATNLFGLQMELDPVEQGVSGRFFVKQDHQGGSGAAHGGVLAAALHEAMALAIHAEGIPAHARRLEVELEEPAPIGTFVHVEAQIDRRLQGTVEASARAGGEGGVRVAAATASFARSDTGSV